MTAITVHTAGQRGRQPVHIEVDGLDSADVPFALSLAERRALHLLARAGLLPTLPRREAG